MRALNSKTPEPSDVDMYLLDVVADDVESLDDVLRRPGLGGGEAVACIYATAITP